MRQRPPGCETRRRLRSRRVMARRLDRSAPQRPRLRPSVGCGGARRPLHLRSPVELLLAESPKGVPLDRVRARLAPSRLRCALARLRCAGPRLRTRRVTPTIDGVRPVLGSRGGDYGSSVSKARELLAVLSTSRRAGPDARLAPASGGSVRCGLGSSSARHWRSDADRRRLRPKRSGIAAGPLKAGSRLLRSAAIARDAPHLDERDRALAPSGVSRRFGSSSETDRSNSVASWWGGTRNPPQVCARRARGSLRASPKAHSSGGEP